MGKGRKVEPAELGEERNEERRVGPRGNQHVRCKDETPYANVLLTMLHKLGVDQASIGDSTGEVAI